ncbi:MAG TPA: acylglycerol kinase family protein, partial [Candidatus Obscuribacter sp.]|nr:acylglycerol kinase family protein [Candidatus Obscuribacter sp.]
MKKVLIIYNPTSGSAAGPELWLGSVVHRLCLDAGTVTVVSTIHGTTPENILPEGINPKNTDLIVAAGGDGTVRMVLHCLASRQLPIPAGIIPLGTGNLLARNLKIYEENLLVDPIEKA